MMNLFHLSQAMCELVKSTSPVSVLGLQLEQLSDQHRALLKEILRLFGSVRTWLNIFKKFETHNFKPNQKNLVPKNFKAVCSIFSKV